MTAACQVSGQKTKQAAPKGAASDCRKSFAEFFALAKNKLKNIFRQGVYLTENTSQAASVEFVRRRRTNSARSRLQKTGGKPRRGFSTS